MEIPLILNLSLARHKMKNYYWELTFILLISKRNYVVFYHHPLPVDGKAGSPAPCPAPPLCSSRCPSWPDNINNNNDSSFLSGSDLCVSRAPAAPDQRAEVLEAEHRPPEEGKVTHADQGHAHQIYQVKLETEKPCIAPSWFHLDWSRIL